MPALPPLPLRPEARPGSEPPRAPLASDRPVPRPGRAYASDGQRLSEPHPDCDGQGLICIRLARRVEDTCSAIETLAKAHDLPPGFFARLIWRESLFDPYAISPAGALGIAQFMPGTARLRGLADPFNPAAALAASAAYLADLRDAYGNLGLAAAAYNGGEERVARFMAGSGGLPGETRAYVAGITGHSAMAWRDAPPDAVDLALADGRPFSESCIELASTRKFPQFRTDPPLAPWAVIVAAHTSRSVAAARYRTAARMNPVLQRHDPVIARVKLASMRGAQYTAQLGAGSRGEAVQLCNQIRQYGSVCTVLRN
ncbi:lytic transglycosylase domain-containing protein [Poseidonocella sp. HB161398]|uniref:lytic transglycosylase domain-containing protein n=1 Tax=Poseidonocella sp. HB161398 TaxID=2320855 RepID=UPI001981F623|nr:lytic transglycosylase domain-containing protein [Poseidonocella sp. HB161398]